MWVCNMFNVLENMQLPSVRLNFMSIDDLFQITVINIGNFITCFWFQFLNQIFLNIF